MLLGAVGSCKATSRFEMNCLIEAFAKAGRPAEVGAKSLQFTDVFQFEFALQNMGYSFDIHGHSIITVQNQLSTQTSTSKSHSNSICFDCLWKSCPTLFQVPSDTPKLVADPPICRICPVQPSEWQHLFARIGWVNLHQQKRYPLQSRQEHAQSAELFFCGRPFGICERCQILASNLMQEALQVPW